MKKIFEDLKDRASLLIKHLKVRQKKKRIAYLDMAPSDNIDDDGVYTNALNWAIRNDKITNIALTGNYGSGKSSLIRTFKKRLWHVKEDNWFKNVLMNCYYYFKFKSLNISLATFVDKELPSTEDRSEVTGSLPNTAVDNNLGNLTKQQLHEIEKSILQQMFYSVKGRRIPSSRFKRINHLSTIKIFTIILSLTTVISLGLSIINPQLINKLQTRFTLLKSAIKNVFFNGISQGEEIAKNITLTSYIIFYIGCFMILVYIVRYFSNSVILGKINISRFEIEVDKQKDDSIFNKYLDEIIYFFQVCRHNLVFIEDLDRFDSVVIFTKLRELNTLINNSEQIKRKVIFIYAIKDDMFLENKERTKFFDFIIPIIPAINASNSNVTLIEKLKEMNLSNELREEFIDEIAIFIDDMRNLKSIVNEFYIYKEKLKNNNKDENGEMIPLDDTKLLSIIVYKNLYPNDFSQLQLGKGLVHEAFMDKNKFLLLLINEIDNNIQSIENRIMRTKNELLHNTEELSLALADYVRNYIMKFHYQPYHQINNIVINGNNYVLNDYSDWKKMNFNELSFDTEIKLSYNHPKLFSLKQLYDYFELSYSFDQRYDAIKLKEENKLKELHAQLNTLKIERDVINSYTLSTLIEKYGEEKVLSVNLRENPFIVFLLRNSYIDEQHQMYVSYFHEGSLTVSDASFVLNVKYRKFMEPSYKLNNKEKIISKLNALDFASKVTLNFDLLNYLLVSIEYNDHEDNLNIKYYNLLIEQLIDELDPQLDFIDTFKRITDYKERFIKTLCHKWANIWDSIEKSPLFSDEKKDEYMRDILMYSQLEDLININASKRIGTYIENNYEFLKIFSLEDIKTIDKIKNVIEILSLKFNTLDIKFKDDSLFDYICNNNFYIINTEMLKLILHHKLKFDLNHIDTKNYSVIVSSEYKPLTTYVKHNIEGYVKNIIIANDNNRYELETAILDLLNEDDKNLSLEIKTKLIEHCYTEISSLNTVDKELWNTLVSEQKVKPSWENVLMYYEYVGCIDDELCNYLNAERVYLDLSKTQLILIDSINNSIKDNLAKDIVYMESISDESLGNLIYCIQVETVGLNFENLSESKSRILIEKNLVLFDENNYKGIRENHRNLLIIFIEKYIKEFLGALAEQYTDNNPHTLYQYDDTDIMSILRSRIITNNQKIDFIKHIDREFKCNNKNVANLIFEYISKDKVFEINKPLFISIFEHLSELNNKIIFLTLQIDYLSESQVFECLELIGGNYAKVGKPNEKLKFNENALNIRLFELLKQKLDNQLKIIRKSGVIYVNSKSDENEV